MSAGEVDLSLAEPAAPQIEGDAPDDYDELFAVDDVADQPAAMSSGLVTEEQVRTLLVVPEGALGMVLGDPDVPDHWRFTDDELDELVPPLTRWINRRPRVAAAVHHGDEVTIAWVLAGYGMRNVSEAARARSARDRYQRELAGEADPAAAAAGGDAGRTDPGAPGADAVRGGWPPAAG